MGIEVSEVSFVVETIYKAGIGIIIASFSSVGSISGYVCKVVGGCVCVPKCICY